MTLRDFFAATEQSMPPNNPLTYPKDPAERAEGIAEWRYIVADAMLEARVAKL
jgi:hypothetical protein